MGKLRVYCLKTLNKLSIYPLDNTPSAPSDFYRRSNTHDPDQDRFEDLYRPDFIHAISRVARHKLAQHRLDPYQRAAFRCGIIHYNTGEEESNPTLELAMEYTGALGTIIFDESCRLCNLTEAQVGCCCTPIFATTRAAYGLVCVRESCTIFGTHLAIYRTSVGLFAMP